MKIFPELEGDETMAELRQMAREYPLFDGIKLAGKGRGKQVVAWEMDQRIQMHNLQVDGLVMRNRLSNMMRTGSSKPYPPLREFHSISTEMKNRLNRFLANDFQVNAVACAAAFSVAFCFVLSIQ